VASDARALAPTLCAYFDAYEAAMGIQQQS
jgi:hypothetical protein